MQNTKLSIFIFAILIAFLGLTSCGSSSTTNSTPGTKTTSSVTSVTLKNGTADAGDMITKQSTDPAFTLTAEVVVTGGAATDVIWTSSDLGVATVATSGQVTVLGGGMTTITATSTVDATKKDSVKLMVMGPTVTSVSIKNGSADAGTVISNQFVASGTLALTADVVVSDGAATTVTWTSSDLGVATVDATGTVTMVALGSTIIKAVSTDNTAREDSVELVLTANAVPATVASVTLKYGGRDVADILDKSTKDTTFTLIAAVAVQGGAPTTVTWTSSDTAVATVDATGAVTIVAVGTTTITATSTEDSTKTDAVSVIVTEAASVSSVTVQSGGLDVATLAKETGDADFTLTANVVVKGGAPTTVTWSSSDTSVATVSANGLVNVIAVGTTTITATSTEDSTKTGSVDLTVTAPAPGASVSSVTVQSGGSDVATLAKETGDADFTLTANVVVTGGAPTTVTWSSSDTSVATVSANGLVNVIADGTTTITATSTHDSTKTGSVDLTVTTPAPGATVSSVALKLNGVDAGANIAKQTGDANFTLTAEVVVTGGAPTTVTWTSSDTSVATVAGGTVTIVAVGTTTITATSTHDGTKTDTVSVTVSQAASVSSVTVQSGGSDVATLAKETGDADFTLTANVVVTGRAPTTVTWSSSDTSVATVSANGLVNIIAVGTTTITATSTYDNSKTGNVDLTVTPPGAKVSSVTLKLNGVDAQTGLLRLKGDPAIALTAEVVVTGGASTTVTWSSSDTSVATVAGGTVTMVAGGTTTITATSVEDNTKTDALSLVVVDNYVGADNIGKTSATIRFSSVHNAAVPSFTSVNYRVYQNTNRVSSLAEAKAGNPIGNAVDVSSIAMNGLRDKSVYYVSVVAVGNDEVYLGSYGFVTGATLYWDATVPQIAGETAGKWDNISSSGVDYDGTMPSTAGISDGYYVNRSTNGGTTFKEITDLRAVFLDALIANSSSFIIAHNRLHHYWRDKSSTQIVSSINFTSPLVRNGTFYFDGSETTRANLRADVVNRRAYTILTTGDTSASQTHDRTFSNYNWSGGKFYRLILFNEELTKVQALAINTFLRDTR